MSQRMPSGSISEVVFARQQCKRGTISLRYQLAEDGCAESQLALAKSLLAETTVNREERHVNANVAVGWLLRAAEKGHREAVQLLKQCSDTGIGINAANCFAVEKCLQLSEKEVIARRVGHSIFSAVMSDTEETVAEEIFKERVEAILNEARKELEASASDSSDNSFKSPPQKVFKENVESPPSSTTSEPCISVGNVVSSVQQCLEGNLPLVALKRVAQYEEYNKWFSLKYAHKLSNMFRNALLILVKDLGTTDLPFALFLCSIFLCMFNSFLTSNDAKNLISDRVFLCTVISLITIQSCSCYIIHLNIGFYEVTRWLDLIKLFEPTVKSDEVKQKYLGKTFFPFLIFVLASVVFNILYPFNSVKFISRELFIFSIVMLVLLDRTITCQRYYVNVSLMLNILSCLSKGNLLTSADFGWLNWLNFKVCFPIYGQYEIHLNWLSCLTLPFVLPYLYSKMAFGNEKRGWYLVLLPHLMCLSWLNLACSFFAVCETGDVFWSFVFWLTVLILTNYFGAVPSLILVSVVKGLYLTGVWSNVSAMNLVFLFLCSFFIFMFLVSKLKAVFKDSTLAFVLSVTFAFIVFLKMSPSSGQLEQSEPVLPWAKYEIYCHRHAWYRSNTAEVEIACLPLKGKKILVEGTVTEIDIVAIKNNVDYFVSVLPSPISQWLTCALGDHFCSKENLTALEKERCSLYDSMQMNDCHLHNWDIYEYRIILEVSSRTSPEVIVKVDHKCSAFVKSLKEGDSLRLTGTLHGSIGSSLPEILLQEATCNTCSENSSCKMLHDTNAKFDLSVSLRHVVKFYFSPFIQPTN